MQENLQYEPSILHHMSAPVTHHKVISSNSVISLVVIKLHVCYQLGGVGSDWVLILLESNFSGSACVVSDQLNLLTVGRLGGLSKQAQPILAFTRHAADEYGGWS